MMCGSPSTSEHPSSRNSVEVELDLRIWRGDTNINELRDVAKWHGKDQRLNLFPWTAIAIRRALAAQWMISQLS